MAQGVLGLSFSAPGETETGQTQAEQGEGGGFGNIALISQLNIVHEEGFVAFAIKICYAKPYRGLAGYE